MGAEVMIMTAWMGQMSPTVHLGSANVKKECIPDEWICDGYTDCDGKSDEEEELCTSICVGGEIFLNGTYIWSVLFSLDASYERPYLMISLEQKFCKICAFCVKCKNVGI